jgi:hypothetical protein
MQRRAAAVYLVLFVALAGGAYAYIEVGASEPEVSLDGPTYTEGDTFSVGDRTYTVTTVEAEVEEGSHGAPDTVTRVGELTWFNESAIATAELENDSTVAFNDGEYTVAIANESNITSFDLVESRNISAILADDPAVEGTATGDDGQEYVRFTNGSTQLLSEYLDPADTVTLSTGDTFPYQQENETIDTTVAAVSSSAVTLQWDNPQNETIDLEEGGNITLNGEQHFAHFPDDSSVKVLASGQYYSSYQSELADISAFDDRVVGLWGIVILSLLSSIILIAAAYLPNKG